MSHIMFFREDRRDWERVLRMQTRMENAKEKGVIIGYTSKVDVINNTVEFEVEYPDDNPNPGTTSYRGVVLPQPVVPSPRPVPPAEDPS